MPEAVHLEYSPKNSDYKLHGVGDRKSFFMPSWVLKTQGIKNVCAGVCHVVKRGMGKGREGGCRGRGRE